MRGLLTRIWIDVRWTVLWFSLGLAAIMGLLTRLLPKVLGNIHEMFDRLPMIKPLLTAMLGIDPGDQVSTQVSQAFLWVHPTVLAVMWGFSIWYSTRVPAGEVEKGTADFLLCLPVSRTRIFLAELIGASASILCILAMGYLGHRLASISNAFDVELSGRSAGYVLGNLGCVSLCVMMFGFLVSACSDSRGRATGLVFSVLLASFLLNFLAQFQDWAKSIRWLSVMEYYRPAIILRENQCPTSDLIKLAALSAVIGCTALIIFQRRRICTT